MRLNPAARRSWFDAQLKAAVTGPFHLISSHQKFTAGTPRAATGATVHLLYAEADTFTSDLEAGAGGSG